MAIELAARKTPVTKEEAVTALWEGYLLYFGSCPTPECIQVIAGQWGLETGWGASMFDFNFGNVKSHDGDGFDYQFFACNELLSRASADRYASQDPEHTKIQCYRDDGNAWIWFYPRHSGCRFRAFESAEQGAADHIALLAKHFPGAMHAARNGDPTMYAHALREAHYYTADESAYAKGLVGCVRAVQGLPVNFDDLPIMTDAQRETLAGWLAMGIELGVEEALEEAAKEREEANRED